MRVTKKIFGKVGFKVVASIFLITAITLSFTQLSCKSKGEKVIKIGAILPLTGNLAFLGQPGKNAILLMNEQLQKEHIKVNLYDSKADPAVALNAFRKAVNVDNVKIFLTTLTGVSLAIKPVAKKEGVFQGIIAIYPRIAEDYEKAFQICYNAVEETKLIIDFVKRKRPNKVFVFASRDPITELQVKNDIVPFLKASGIKYQVEHFNIGDKYENGNLLLVPYRFAIEATKRIRYTFLSFANLWWRKRSR